MSVKVFVAYANSDAQYARRLIESLRPEFDVVNAATESHAGADWAPLLREALASVDAFLVLLSKSALRSTWINFEIGAAVGLGKRVIPISLDDPDTLDWDSADFMLRDLQLLDAHGLAPSHAAKKIHQVVRSHL